MQVVAYVNDKPSVLSETRYYLRVYPSRGCAVALPLETSELQAAILMQTMPIGKGEYATLDKSERYFDPEGRLLNQLDRSILSKAGDPIPWATMPEE